MPSIAFLDGLNPMMRSKPFEDKKKKRNESSMHIHNANFIMITSIFLKKIISWSIWLNIECVNNEIDFIMLKSSSF